MKKLDLHKIEEEVESFRTEYPEHDSEMVEEYIRLLDDFNRTEKDEFAKRLGY